MIETDSEFAAAADALKALADGPGRAAADTLVQVFDNAGARIEGALSQAARSGELDFQRMAESVLGDLARIAAEALILSGRGASSGQGVNMTLNFAQGADRREAAASGQVIATTLARLAVSGGRFL